MAAGEGCPGDGEQRMFRTVLGTEFKSKPMKAMERFEIGVLHDYSHMPFYPFIPSAWHVCLYICFC